MRITEAKMIKLGACDGDWKKYFIGKKSVDVKLILDAAIADENYSYAQWGLSRLMTHKQQIKWAVYCAEQVIKIYEDKYPDNPAPRNAINAAKKYLRYPTEKNKYAAFTAANAAANAANAADTDVDADADAAGHAADSATYAADSAYAACAAYAAANAANAAASAASYAASYAAAYAASAAEYKKMQEKLLHKGLSILLEQAK